MGIKGSATIELTNADGSKEIYKHDNMITNAVNDLCMSQRGEIATILKIVDNGDSYAQALFGGLLLFDETLNNDPADYFLPTAKCTGYASQDAYAGLDVCRGSFNASEGGVQADGSYKFVWDFATSQANGTIKSLALVPNMMGQIGLTYSQISKEKKEIAMKRDYTAPFNENGYMIEGTSSYDGFPASGIYIIAVIDDIAYAASSDNIGFQGGSAPSSLVFTNNGGVLKLLRFKLGASSIALSDKVAKASYIDTLDIQLPTEFMNTITYISYKSLIALNYDVKRKKLIVFPCSRSADLSVNSTIKYCEIDMSSSDYASSVYTFTNTTAGAIDKTGYTGAGYSNSYPLYVMKDWIVAVAKSGSTRKVYAINKSDNTQVKEFKYANNDVLEYASDVRHLTPIFWSDNLLFARFGTSGGAVAGYFVFDMSTGLVAATNISSMSQSNNIDIGSASIFASTGKNLKYTFSVNPFILCTKNNLSAPVTKTASQTMKITYTLTVADATGSEG